MLAFAVASWTADSELRKLEAWTHQERPVEAPTMQLSWPKHQGGESRKTELETETAARQRGRWSQPHPHQQRMGVPGKSAAQGPGTSYGINEPRPRLRQTEKHE